jgi:hypothetical protein
MRAILIAPIAAAVALLPAVPADAESAVTHLTLHEHEVSTDHFAAGQGICVDYAGTLVEDRRLDAQAVQHESAAGLVNLTFTVRATLSITPDDPAAGPTYIGSYVEKGAGIVETAPDQDRAITYHVVAAADGSDRSTLRFLLRGHITVTPEGTVHAARDQLTCARP